MKYFLKREDGFIEIDVQQKNGQLTVAHPEGVFEADIHQLESDSYAVEINHQSYFVRAKTLKNAVQITIGHQEYVIPIYTRQQKIESEIFGSTDEKSSSGEVRAPMPGMVLRVEVETGQTVETGQPLLVIEAMKMENEIRARESGTVSDIFVKAHQAVEKDDLLIKLNN